MGEYVKQNYVALIIAQMNFRFGPGDPLREMVALQREFEVFSPVHSLRDSFNLLNVGPQDERQRRGFFRYLDDLKNIEAEGAGLKKLDGHTAIITALQKNLEGKSPTPVFFSYHLSARGKQSVKVSTAAAMAFSAVKYLTISLPTLAEK
jgi:hypothetical protein